jgi:UDP-N-acetyl-D-mannosaminuronate dehydrogenase
MSVIAQESPALDVMRMLIEKGAILSYNDPFVTTLRMNGQTLKSVDLTNSLPTFKPKIASSFSLIIVTMIFEE